MADAPVPASPPDVPVLRFRFHRGSLADSMATLREFRSVHGLLCALQDALGAPRGCTDPSPTFRAVLRCEPYGEGPDRRIGWDRTYILSTHNYGVLGFADRNINELPENP